MAMSKLNAWTIFKAVSQGKIEGQQAEKALLGEELTEYEAHKADLEFELGQAIVSINNEAAELLGNSPVAQRLETTPAHEYTAADYRDLVSIFEGGKYEKLHLSAFFRVNNSELLFELVKPAA